ncbi:hypothetical protein B0T24DRAFT_525392 [Lasiosphaeria ovina]|uniref:Meiotic recombination protein DMC1 n=1 Tax=Lasiosphaeria ovina TaxID=92902 RepID=A0AAE0NAS1_9PEZI|nr:hypothetical protein B0T24DRAFT_525392 [Lasiosphaeria ovina]
MADRVGTPATGAGGFVVDALPSPAPSTAPTRSISGLPHPRGRALRPGSAKEDMVRHFVTDRMMHISRRFAKKSGVVAVGSDEFKGYKSMAELCKDVEDLVNVIWLSGTPSLQIPYLLNVAGEFNTWVAAFSASPKATFSLLRKLDHCFASLLSGEDFDTKETLPGFENGLRAGMSRTDMVRCRSLVQQTRVLVVHAMSQGPGDEDEDNYEDGRETDHSPGAEETDSGPDGPGRPSDSNAWDNDDNDDDDVERLEMDVARVYEKTLVKLGETLGEGGGVGDIQISAD